MSAADTGAVHPREAGGRDVLAPALSLFASTSTLICCALPVLLVTLGLGASLAGLVSVAPWLVELTRWKVWLFAGSGVMLAGAGWLTWRARFLPCPADPGAARACMRLRMISGWMMGFSALVWLIGFFFAFLAADLLL